MIPSGSSVSASSVWGNDAIGIDHGQGELHSHQAWSASVNQVGEYWQMDMGSTKAIAGVVTQGRYPDGTHYNWVKSYKVRVSSDGSAWSNVDGDAVFPGNTDMDTVISQIFANPVNARYVKILPQTWHGHMSMRSGILLAPYVPYAVGSTHPLTDGLISLLSSIPGTWLYPSPGVVDNCYKTGTCATPIDLTYTFSDSVSVSMYRLWPHPSGSLGRSQMPNAWSLHGLAPDGISWIELHNMQGFDVGSWVDTAADTTAVDQLQQSRPFMLAASFSSTQFKLSITQCGVNSDAQVAIAEWALFGPAPGKPSPLLVSIDHCPVESTPSVACI